MSAGQIRVTPEQLASVASQLNGGASSIDGILSQLAGNVGQHGNDAFANGRRLHARQLETKRTDDVHLLDVTLAVPEESRLVVMLRELLRLAPDFVFFHGLWKRHETRGAGLERTAARQRIWLV